MSAHTKGPLGLILCRDKADAEARAETERRAMGGFVSKVEYRFEYGGGWCVAVYAPTAIAKAEG